MLWYSLEAPRRGASNEYPQHMFSWINKKNIGAFQLKNAPYLELFFLFLLKKICCVLIRNTLLRMICDNKYISAICCLKAPGPGLSCGGKY